MSTYRSQCGYLRILMAVGGVHVVRRKGERGRGGGGGREYRSPRGRRAWGGHRDARSTSRQRHVSTTFQGHMIKGVKLCWLCLVPTAEAVYWLSPKLLYLKVLGENMLLYLCC